MAWTPHKEGDAVTLAAVNANISALETQANSASADAVFPKSLHSQHLPSAVGESVTKMVYGETQSYINEYPGWGVDTVGGGIGWAVVANSTHGDLEVSLTGVDLTKHKLLVMANIGVKNVNHATTNNAGKTEGVAAVKLQAKIGGVWTGLARTERYISSKRTVYNASTTTTLHGDIPIRTLIDSTDGQAVTGVRAVVSVSYPLMTTTVKEGKVVLLACNLSAITIKQAI